MAAVGIKLWHDDVRAAPSGWVWAQNNDDAKEILKTGEVVEISMDHDLGASPSDGLFARGSSEDNGQVLAQWMVDHDLVPAAITIHSWNPYGARTMASIFERAGHQVILRAFNPHEHQYSA